jgi:lysyl-tRNA synthetase class 2
VTDDNVPEQVRVRLDKRARLIESGIDPYPVNFPRTHTAAALRARFGELPADTATGEQAAVAGRVMLSRVGGKLCFATLRGHPGDALPGRRR